MSAGNRKRDVYLYVCDTMADWETGFAVAELNTGRFFKDRSIVYLVRTVGLTTAMVTTMGGVRILPELPVDEMVMDDADMLILPGGESWREVIHEPILRKAAAFLDGGKWVAAICGATMALAARGHLDNRSHTSNDLGYLKAMCPSYKGEAFYRSEPAVRDRKLITASGIAALEFAREILGGLEVLSPEALAAWYKLFKLQDARYYLDLEQALQRI